MTKDAHRAFLDSQFAPVEATRSAFRVHKRLLYHTCEHPEAFLKPVTADLEAFEAMLLAEQSSVEEQASQLLEAGVADSASVFLTRYAEARLLGALALGEALVKRTEDQTRERFGIRMPEAEVPDGASWLPESQPMTLRSGRPYHRCLSDGLDEYPRLHGSYASLASDSLLDAVLGSGQSSEDQAPLGATGMVALGVLCALFGLGIGRLWAGR
jgi:hypothetical protein